MKSTLLATAFLMLVCLEAMSQKMPNGLKCTVMDSLTGKPMASATVTIYKSSDSTVIKYGFTNNSGIVKFESLPFDTTLLVMISYIGYNSYHDKFRVTKTNPMVINSIALSKKANQLDEVTISAQRPPLYMQGDTLIVNPEAFKTKENAVVEDVLRKVPGIVVWADGKISVNGKSVNKLLVAGKTFFGGDPVVAIRNLPKETIDKVKIYEDKEKVPGSDDESSLTMDITLKKGSETGLFGKAGLGIGTSKRNEGNIISNSYNPKTQLSLLAVFNNINKQVFDVRSMLQQTVYKPGGNDNTSYQSNFAMEGLNRFRAGGLNFDRDWSNTSNSKTSYFAYSMNNKTDKDIFEVTGLDNSTLNKNIQESSESSRDRHYFTTFFKDTKRNYDFNFEPLVEREQSTDSRTSQMQIKEGSKPVSNSSGFNNTKTNLTRFIVNTEYRRKKDVLGGQKYLLRYKFNSNSLNTNELLKSNFVSYDPSASPEFDVNRKKHANQKNFSQEFLAELDLQDMFKLGGRINYQLVNTLTHKNQKNQQQVNNFNGSESSYSLIDNSLTNVSQLNLFEERPGIKISTGKVIQGIRNTKMISLSALGEMQYIKQSNESLKLFQQLNKTYTSFLPSVMASFNHIKDGKFNKTYTLRYFTTIAIPTIEDLAPLVDSAYQYYIKLGNSRLKKQFSNELYFKFQNYKSNNAGSFGIELRAGQANQKLVDSSFYDDSGRRISYAANANGYQYLSASLSYEKSGMLFKNPFGIKVFPKIELSENPYYINGQPNISKNLLASFLTMINYVQNDLLLYDLTTNIITNRNIVGDKRFSSTYLSTGASVQLSWPKHTTIVNTVGYTLNSNNYSKNVDYFIWNANIYYRLLKNEQLEIKLTATDLLRQRSNVIRYVDNNTFSSGLANNLQQFFMIGISYYPRSFGLKKK